MRSNKEDNIPLVAVKPNKSNYLRTTSCFDEPEVSVIGVQSIDWKFFISKQKRMFQNLELWFPTNVILHF